MYFSICGLSQHKQTTLDWEPVQDFSTSLSPVVCSSSNNANYSQNTLEMAQTRFMQM